MFSLNLKKYREEAQLSQHDLAKLLGVSQGSIGNWETGAREPSLDMINRIADTLGVETAKLIAINQPSSEPKSVVYDDDVLELMEEFHKRPELKILFSTSKKARKEDIEAVDKLLKHMAGRDNDDK